MTEDEIDGFYQWLDGCEFEWTPGVGDGQGGLACCDSWGRKESDTTERLNWTELKAHLTSHSRMSDSRWVTTPSWLSCSLRPFLYSYSVYSCHRCLISSTSVRSLPFLSLIMPILAWNSRLISLIFLKRSLVFPILLFSSISLHCSFNKAFLSLLAILCNSAFSRVYLSLSLLPFTSLLFSAICKVSSDNHFIFLHFFFFGMVLITASHTMSQTSLHSSSGSLCTRSNPLNLFVTFTV